MAAPSFITTTAMEPLLTSRSKLASPTKGDGQPAQDGLTTTRTAGSIWLSPTTSNGLRRTISGAANTGRGTVLIAIPGTTEASASSSTTTIMTEPSPT